MPTKHTVQEGECVSSIAHDYGLLPNTVWEYEENRTLRELRKNPNVLLPGDVLVIPDKLYQLLQLRLTVPYLSDHP